MTTLVDPTALASGLCDELVQEVATRRGRSFIVTTCRYVDGDTVNLYLERRDGSMWFSDAGTTLHKAEIDGLKITENRQRVIGMICRVYGVEESDSAFCRKIDAKKPTESFLALCEAITRISTLRYELLQRKHSDLRESIEALLDDRVAPIRKWETNWTNRTLDRKGSFPIDYRFNGELPERHLFRVASPYKAALVAAVANFYGANGVSVPTMCVIDPEANLGDQHINRVQSVSTDICFGLEADRIVKFALGR